MTDEEPVNIPEGCREVLRIYSDDDCKKVLGVAKVRKMSNEETFELLKRAVYIFGQTFINPPPYPTYPKPDKYANEPNDFVEWLKKPKDKE